MSQIYFQNVFFFKFEVSWKSCFKAKWHDRENRVQRSLGQNKFLIIAAILDALQKKMIFYGSIYFDF